MADSFPAAETTPPAPPAGDDPSGTSTDGSAAADHAVVVRAVAEKSRKFEAAHRQWCMKKIAAFVAAEIRRIRKKGGGRLPWTLTDGNIVMANADGGDARVEAPLETAAGEDGSEEQHDGDAANAPDVAAAADAVPTLPAPLPPAVATLCVDLPGALRVESDVVWDVAGLRHMQEAALHRLFDPTAGQKLLLVQRTGGGKTHVIRMLGTTIKGIALIVHPLLALTADQVPNFTKGTDRYACASIPQFA